MMREKMGRSNSNLLWLLLIMLSNNLILPVFSTSGSPNNTNFGNEKNYYTTPDPHVVSNPPSGFHSNPSHSPSKHGSTHHNSHGSSIGGPAQSNCGPAHRGGSGGSGHYYPTPKPIPTPPSPSGGHYYPTPKPTPPRGGGGSGGGGGCRCPSPPSPPPSRGGGGGGGYYGPPTTPLVPSPSPPPPRGGGGGGGYYGPPTTPLVPSPPYITPVTPIVPSPPLVPVPTPTPVPFDPNRPPFPCTFWGSHPGLIFGLFGWWATIGGVFGATTLPGLNSADYTLQQALTNPRNDGYGSLYREGTASFLNSMATKEFPFSTNQVKESFLSSLSTDKAAAAQARLFKLANEGKFKLATTYNP